jgi:hypothetical protein
MKKDPATPPKMSPRAQNLKKGPDALGTAENEYGSVKHENGTRRLRYRRKLVRERKIRKRDPSPPISPKMSLGAQNIKTGPDALGTAENESLSTIHENGTRRPQHRRKRVREQKTRKRDPSPPLLSKTSPRAQNMKTGPDVLGTAENVSLSTKHEIGTRRPR